MISSIQIIHPQITLCFFYINISLNLSVISVVIWWISSKISWSRQEYHDQKSRIYDYFFVSSKHLSWWKHHSRYCVIGRVFLQNTTGRSSTFIIHQFQKIEFIYEDVQDHLLSMRGQKKKDWDECKYIYFRDISGASTWIQRDIWISLFTSTCISLENSYIHCPSNYFAIKGVKNKFSRYKYIGSYWIDRILGWWIPFSVYLQSVHFLLQRSMCQKSLNCIYFLPVETFMKFSIVMGCIICLLMMKLLSLTSFHFFPIK